MQPWGGFLAFFGKNIQKKATERSYLYYEGKFGKSNQTKVTISSRYGDVRIKTQ